MRLATTRAAVQAMIPVPLLLLLVEQLLPLLHVDAASPAVLCGPDIWPLRHLRSVRPHQNVCIADEVGERALRGHAGDIPVAVAAAAVFSAAEATATRRELQVGAALPEALDGLFSWSHCRLGWRARCAQRRGQWPPLLLLLLLPLPALLLLLPQALLKRLLPRQLMLRPLRSQPTTPSQSRRVGGDARSGAGDDCCTSAAVAGEATAAALSCTSILHRLRFRAATP